MSLGIKELVDAMRESTSMNSPAGMAALLTEGAAMIEELVSHEQMTLEDLFAQSALGAILEHRLKNGYLMPDGAADEAYSVAEAMMERRKK